MYESYMCRAVTAATAAAVLAVMQYLTQLTTTVTVGCRYASTRLLLPNCIPCFMCFMLYTVCKMLRLSVFNKDLFE